jgi:hypothetical protein
MEKLKVFFSWSGPRSKAVAEALRTWLPDVLPMTEPWLSAADIEPGAKWRQAISGELETTNFTILCLTPGNLLSPWLLFEAGALSKHFGSRVCTYLVDLNPTDVKDPLSQFQHTRANQGETKQLIATINKKLADMALDDARLDRAFARCWPEFEKSLKALPSEAVETAPKNPMEKVPEIVAEILERVREANKLQGQDQGGRLRELSPLDRELVQTIARRIDEVTGGDFPRMTVHISSRSSPAR